METHGRMTIYANYTEKQLLKGSVEEQGLKVLDILENSIEIHERNKNETKYLQDYLYGLQDIKDKVKYTRTEINNKSVENWAYAFLDWKKAFLLGKPIQYAPLDDVANEEISLLNKYFIYEDKDQLDQDLYEDVYTGGRGYRYNYPSKMGEDDEAPFELLNLDSLNTEVVYSSSINHEQLLTYVETDKKYICQEVNPDTGELEIQNKYYNEYTTYTRNMMYIVDNKLNKLRITDMKPIAINDHIVTEYYLNKRRMGWLEIGKEIFDDINSIENMDKDDIEAFVNNIMVFTNAQVDKKGMEAIKEFGAVSIRSTDQKQAKVEILQNRLKSLDSQAYYLRKLSALHSILGVPQASNNGDFSNAETGKAVLVGSGFTSSSIRVETEEKAFKKYDRNSLKVILKICRSMKDSGIKNLKVSDIDIKFSRDLSDNLLTKAQALVSLATAKIPPEIRNAVVGLFSDPVAVTKLQKEYEAELQRTQKELQATQKSSNNIENDNFVNQQNNETQDIQQKEEQAQ